MAAFHRTSVVETNPFRLPKAANDLNGRASARDKIAESVAKAREWAESELSKDVQSATKGEDRNAVRASLAKIASAFAGEPEAKDAENGTKAITKLGVIETLAAEQQAAAKDKAAKDFAGTRWAALFGGAAAEKPTDGK